jgi:hypothetical protein
MKAYITLAAVAALTACSTAQPPAHRPVVIDRSTYVEPNPNTTTSAKPTIYKLKGYEGPEAMSAEEVRQAQKHCILSKMQPITQFLTVRIDTGSKVQVPVGVVCESF